MLDGHVHGPARSTPVIRRPRPVADAPVVALADGTELARAWLLELIARAPLEQVAEIPVVALAEHGPSVCAAVIRAIGSDAELARLEVGGDLAAIVARAGALAGASDPAGAAAAVEALRAAAWHELRSMLRRPPPELPGDLAERLSHVCAAVLQAVLTISPTDAGPDDGAISGRRARRDAASQPLERWRASIVRAIGSAAGAPVSALAVEVDDGERLLAAGEDGEIARALGRVERALETVLDPGSDLVALGAGRYGVTVPGADGASARVLGERLAGALAAAAAPRGVPLRASVGLAAFPADGVDAATLAARAEERALAARAAGVPFA